ncbi:DUF2478 domain-containing protein [Rhodobacter sp. Har01]|uniref:DUF2478 domain-containing protein n=1 Tax=Rhodobacter sp. Har01 TaxID=2883999 RepID=UPI001D07B85E|nr:DUF2478 domain-containing protein [Rhodobacter sp. Har01]MCB6179305.1 DUF2478 domain-containing protein [Rhodobacter sp. Har01]
MENPGIAAVFMADKAEIDPKLAALVATLAAEGWRVAGLLQTRSSCGDMAVCELVSGQVFGIAQNLGPAAQGCKLDPRGLAEAAGAALGGLQSGADLLVIPRFGQAEAEGHGVRAVIEQACQIGVPVLVAVREGHAPAWERFAGGLAKTLPADLPALLTWCRRARAAARA